MDEQMEASGLMTPEAQRIAIAEACGWKNCRCDDGTLNMPPKGEPDDDFNRDVIEHKNCKPYCGFPVDPHREVLPDYLNDLNAIHEAEKYAGEHLMDGDQWEEYGRQLERMHPQACVKAADGSIDYYDLATLMTELTAAQRAEAFLRTLGLWT